MPNGDEVGKGFAMNQGHFHDGSLPPSNGMNLDPRYLLGHENHFDPNVYTPEQMIQKGALRGPIDPIKTA